MMPPQHQPRPRRRRTESVPRRPGLMVEPRLLPTSRLRKRRQQLRPRPVLLRAMLRDRCQRGATGVRLPWFPLFAPRLSGCVRRQGTVPRLVFQGDTDFGVPRLLRLLSLMTSCSFRRTAPGARLTRDDERSKLAVRHRTRFSLLPMLYAMHGNLLLTSLVWPTLATMQWIPRMKMLWLPRS